MNAQQTPGPWIATPDPHGSPNDWAIGIGDGAPVDYVAVCSERDAALIAAAPKLLDIARRLAVYLPAQLQPEVNAVIAEALGHEG